MHKPHHTPHAYTPTPEWPTVDTTVPEQDPLTVLVKASDAGWTATATFGEFTTTETRLGPCDAAQAARSALLVLLLTPSE